MTENPDIILLNIRHYQELLKLNGTPNTHDQVRKLLADAEARLPIVAAEASERKL